MTSHRFLIGFALPLVIAGAALLWRPSGVGLQEAGLWWVGKVFASATDSDPESGPGCDGNETAGRAIPAAMPPEAECR